MSDDRAARLGARVAHQVAGTLSNGHVLTTCGRTLDPHDLRFQRVKIEDVPIFYHCLQCWG